MHSLGPQLKKILCFIFLLIPIIGIASQAFGLEIKINKKATVSGEKIRLGDVASFDPADDNRVSRLKKIEISSSPPPGREAAINIDLLAYKINPSMGNEKDVLVKAPEHIIVYRKAQIIDSSRLEEMFMEHIIQSSPWSRDKVNFEKINTPDRITLPEGKLEWDIRGNDNQDYLGNVALTINFRIDGRPYRNISISGRVSVSQQVLKATKRIKRGQLLSENDLALATENILKYREGTLKSLEEALGKRSIRSIPSGRIILSSMIEVPPMVQKGNQVLIKVENENIRITATGEAMEDGRSGEKVRIMNINSGKEVSAVVKGPDVVQVYF